MTGEELSDLDRDAEALAELLLTMADDEFVLGFWDSEWTGIAPMLEEDVAMSSCQPGRDRPRQGAGTSSWPS